MKKKRLLLALVAVILAAVITTLTAVGVEVAKDRTITVDFDNVITEEFHGVGSNVWGGSFTAEERKSLGTNEANFALSEKRIATVEPGPIRTLVLPGWMMDYSDGADGEINWKNGVYDFNTDRMQTIVKYCETFKAAGTPIQINFGGSADDRITGWYPIQDTADILKAAPADLKAHAKAVSALLQYLWGLGFDNVKYLSFYNETNGNNFQAFGDEREYWVAMIKEVDAQLKADGVRDKIKIIGTELTADGSILEIAKDWLEYVHNNAAGAYDILSAHLYMSDVDKNETTEYLNGYESMVDFLGRVRKVIGDDELWVTEFSWNARRFADKGDTSFRVSQASTFMACANSGVATASHWFFMGTMIPTLGMNLTSHSTLWAYPAAYERVFWQFEEMGLLMRYVPKNSKVVTVSEEHDDILATAFLADDGNVTVVVETDESLVERDITINFGKKLNKTFRRHSMEYPANDKIDSLISDGGNAILPVSEKEISVTDTLTDTVGKGHQLIIYTSMDEEQQVVFDGSVGKTVKTGGELQINVKEVYGTDNDAVSWSIYSCVEPDGTATYNKDGADMSMAGTIDQNGKYSAKNVPAGTQLAIKATTADGSAYGIAYIKVTE